MAEEEREIPIEIIKKEVREKAYDYEKRYHGCSQCTFQALQETLGMDDSLAFKAASTMCGGLGFSGHTCGALSAGVMILSMKYGREKLDDGLEGLLTGALPSYQLVSWFQEEFGSALCRDISGFEISEEGLKAAAAAPETMASGLDEDQFEKCCQLVGKTAERVIEIIDKTDRQMG